MFPVATCAKAAGARPTAASRTRARARHADLINALLSDCPGFGRALREQAEDGGPWGFRRTARTRGGPRRGAEALGGRAQAPLVHAPDDRLERLAQRSQAVAGLPTDVGRDRPPHQPVPLHLREVSAQRLLGDAGRAAHELAERARAP